MTGVRQVDVAAEDAEVRLDRWLRRRHPHVTQARIERMCRKGELRVDGGRVRPATRLIPGQVVRIPPLPDAGKPVPERETRVSEDQAEWIRGAVIYRDDHLLALNKPPGLSVQGGSRQTIHLDALAEALRFGAEAPPRLVHRLDKDTSGVLVMARSPQVAAKLTAVFRSREAQKVYWAVVAGSPSPRMGTIRYGLVKASGHGKGGTGEKMVCVHPDRVGQVEGAKWAHTDYAVIEAAARRAAWTALVPVTGRTHQLRAHMAEIGHPIVGDGKYGTNSQENRGEGWGAQLGGSVSRKLHLHARSLEIPHPQSGKPLRLLADLPDHMARTWELFGWNIAAAPDNPFEAQR
ncbi:MAG: RluA family pseudouridine synthase [Pseudomonadota bacterium]